MSVILKLDLWTRGEVAVLSSVVVCKGEEMGWDF